MWESAAASVSCAKLCLDDVREWRDEQTEVSLHCIVQNAVQIGNVHVLEWARSNGFEFNEHMFNTAVIQGHVRVLQWAEEKHLTWYYEYLPFDAARCGHIPIFEWIHNTRGVIPKEAVNHASEHGQLPLLIWMEEHKLLGSDTMLCFHASFGGQTEVLEWLLANGYISKQNEEAIVRAAIATGNKCVLIFARSHGIGWDESTCAQAARSGNLHMLQWLRENDCPWDSDVLLWGRRVARYQDVVDWAIANGCPDYA